MKEHCGKRKLNVGMKDSLTKQLEMAFKVNVKECEQWYKKYRETRDVK